MKALKSAAYAAAYAASVLATVVVVVGLFAPLAKAVQEGRALQAGLVYAACCVALALWSLGFQRIPIGSAREKRG